MRTLRQRKYLFALLAILALFAACKGESPTAPPLNSGGGGTPPAGASVVITASNLNPASGSVTTITVTVTQNNQPVANGTAVELSTTRGNFVDLTTGASLGTATVLTTNNGQVQVNLTSSSAGAALIRAVVNNVAAELTVTFQAGPVDDGGGDGTTPTISSFDPTFGRPEGGQLVKILGTNFRAPARVLFDFGPPVGTKEAFVVSVTAKEIQVLTPAVDLAGAQALPATIKVIVGAGATGEQTVSATTPFNFQLQILTPVITTLSPASGPIDGGTRVTIFGSGFQAPVQVFFASAEAQVLNTTFNQIIVISPAGRDTNPDGSGPATGPIPVKVINIGSSTNATLAAAFRYTPKMQITAAGPTQGPFTGGTRVTIDGIGFNDPVAVSIGGVAAQPIKVSGTQIIAVTLPLLLTSCGGVSGPISVTNVDNGDSATATGITFTYQTPNPTIVNVNPATVAAGGSTTVSVFEALPGVNKFTVGDKSLFPTSTVPTPNGVDTIAFGLTLPLSFTFPSAACTSGGLAGTQLQPITVSVTYLNVNTGCTDTAANALTINPLVTACVVPPSGTVTAPGAVCPNAGTVSLATPTTPTTTITIANNSATTQNLLITNATISGTNAADFSINPTTGTAAPEPAGPRADFIVTFTPIGVTTGSRTATVTFTTNSPTTPTVTVNLCALVNP